jgi:hypothetical protein
MQHRRIPILIESLPNPHPIWWPISRI